MSDETKVFITENKTFISVSMLVIILGLATGIITTAIEGRANASGLTRFKDYQIRQNELMMEKLDKLGRSNARIEGKLGIPGE